MAWLMLFVAGLVEIAMALIVTGTVGLRLRRSGPS